jgi:hypothetical protein
MRNFIGKRVDQSITSKFFDKNGHPINVGDKLYFTYRFAYPQYFMVLALNEEETGHYRKDGIRMRRVGASTDTWELKENLIEFYEVVS